MAEPFSAHYFMLVDAGRGVRLRDFLMAILGADRIHQHWRSSGSRGRAAYLLTVYLQVRATRMIIELREVPRQIVFENQSNAAMCVYVDNVLVTFNQAIGLGAQNIGGVEVGHTHIYRVRDPCGFIWCLAPRDMAPQMLPTRALHIHYMMFIDRAIARIAFDWYKTAFGAVPLQEYHGPIAVGEIPHVYRYLLRIGTEARHLILEIVETYDNPMIPYESNELIYIFTNDLPGFIQRIHEAGDAHVETEPPQEDEDQPSLFYITDPFGYHWHIESINGIPNQVLNTQYITNMQS